MKVGIEVNGVNEDVTAGDLSSGSASLKQDADPIVYKLVRVDYDGRFVPATDDELMEVEDLLELENNGMLSLNTDIETIAHIPDKDELADAFDQEKTEGSSKVKLTELDEENVSFQGKDSMPTSASSPKDGHVKGSSINGEESNSSVHDGLNKNECTGSKPDFSLLKGEIDLDRLSIRELHETFRATFGRKTSVKDKMWLKRRIAMGLTNCYDISVTSFVIKDGKFLKKKELCKNSDCGVSVAEEIYRTVDDGPVNLLAPNLREVSIDDVELSSFTESGCRSDDNLENRAAKRARKPTKRYIEELSDREKDSSGKSTSPSKHFGQNKGSSKETSRCSVPFSDFVTRPDSIGGSGVQVPYVSRIRRCRPRKSIMALTKFNSSDVSLARKIVASPVAESKSQPDDHNMVKIVRTKSMPFGEPIVSDEKDKLGLLSVPGTIFLAREPKSVDSVDNTQPDDASGNYTDDHVATVPTVKGGMRRKHHRAWSLTEVMKLVDGVAKFGAGRWSEIKRLSFSSYAHRTSVDLKDKWRNLLKASFANTQTEKGMIPRKNAPLPIPATILVKVRELAELNGQAPQGSKASGNNNSGSSVNEHRSGYL